MNAVTGTWIKVGELADIPKQGARCIDAGELTIAIFRGANDEVFALKQKVLSHDVPLLLCDHHNLLQLSKAF